jgi:dihydroneopterin aldolase
MRSPRREVTQMPIDKVLVRAIRLDASVGTLPWEKQVRQPLEVDVDAEVDTTELLRSRDLAAGVDFTVVIQTVREVVLAGHVELVEVLADGIAQALLASTPACRVRVEVRKYSACAGLAGFVGVEVHRERGHG